MKTYARLDADGFLLELIEPITDDDGVEVPIAARFHPSIVATLEEVDPANPPHERPAQVAPLDQAKAIARAKDKRKLVLDALTGIAGRLQRAGDSANAAACDTLAVQLLAINLKTIAAAATSDDDFDGRVLTAYRTLAAGAPGVVAAAFGELS